MPESQLKPNPCISMIMPLPVSLLLIVFFFLPWLTISCDAGEFTSAIQSSGILKTPLKSPMPHFPKISAKIAQSSGWQLAQGEIKLEGACARQESPVGSDNDLLKSRPWLFVGLVAPVLALLLGCVGATGNASAKTVGTGLLLMGIAGVATVLLAASIDYVDDAMEKFQEEAPVSSCRGQGPCPTVPEDAGDEMKKIVKTEATIYLWISLGMYVLLAGCGIAGRGEPTDPDLQREHASAKTSGLADFDLMVSKRSSTDGLPDFGPTITPYETADKTKDAAAPDEQACAMSSEETM